MSTPKNHFAETLSNESAQVTTAGILQIESLSGASDSKELVFKKDLRQQDAKLALEQLKTQGYYPISLEYPFLLRGDQRSPNIVFNEGLYRRSIEFNECKSSITEDRESINCIACTKDLVYAVGFADAPATTQGMVNQREKYGWVYLIYAKEGIDISNDDLYPKSTENKAKLVNEVVLTGVPPENILAAFQIKTTSNSIHAYLNLEFNSFSFSGTQWQVLVTDYHENASCFLRESDNELYHKTIDRFFSEVKEKGYYRIPWSPEEEDKNFLVTHDLTPMQKRAFNHGLSKEEAKRYHARFHVDALEQGVPPERVHTCIKSQFHLSAYKDGQSLDILSGCNYYEAYGLTKNLSIEQVKGLNSEQIDILLLGFNKKDIPRISDEHILAAKKGISIKLLSQVNSAQAYGLYRNVAYEKLINVSKKEQVEGLLIGFSVDDVASSWFGKEHVIAINIYQRSPDELRNLSTDEVKGMTSQVRNPFYRVVTNTTPTFYKPTFKQSTPGHHHRRAIHSWRN